MGYERSASVYDAIFEPGRVCTDFVEQPGLTVARITRSELDGHLSKLTMHHSVDRQGTVDHYVEHHDLAMYTPEEYLAALRAAGLDAWHEADGLMGRGLFVGVKPWSSGRGAAGGARRREGDEAPPTAPVARGRVTGPRREEASTWARWSATPATATSPRVTSRCRSPDPGRASY